MPLAEQWNGGRWTIQPTPTANHLSKLTGVSCISPNDCTAVGSYGSTLAERWNGKKWAIQKTASRAGLTYSQLQGVSCTSANACIAVGESYNHDTTVTLAERWNGTQWTIQQNPSPYDSNELHGVSCASRHACIAVGVNAGFPVIQRWNGTTWTEQRSAYPPPGSNSAGGVLSGASCPSATRCTAVGIDSDSTVNSHGIDEVRDATLAEHWKR